ncbi:EamA-like transporter family protein [Leishmania donovani]|uniref:EamA-like transporter family protein n=1 Tax=Leishmania donovani TaxID=5661 RepID=A0A504Y4T8_LEIDO|nr:EamA-like transporter family protein [Leishmania donovani]
MPSCLSPFTRESAAGAAGTEDIDDAPGSTIIAAQRSRLRELVDRAYSEALRTVAHLRLLMPLSKYGLGVALILCVTVIWVASSVWIQYIFGSLEFNKPFFLTYFNTTGFCLWNAGFFFSARWRRTPWDETSRTQPVCIEDARLDSREPSSTEEAEAEAGEDASIGAVREAPHHSRSVSGVSPTLSHTVPHCRSLAEWELQRPLNHCSPSSNLISHAVPHSTQPPHYGHALLSRSAITAVSARHAGTPPPTPRLPPHQVLISVHGTGRKEVVSVILADEDELADATLWQVATRREVVISSKMLRHNGTEAPPRRRYRQRARRQRIRRYSLRRIWRCALVFCPLWFLANYLFNLSLSITSVASNTILSSTSSIWALFLSHMVLRQPVGAHRLVAVVLSVSGTVVVGLSDKDAAGGHSTVGGNIVALLSAFFYAAYTSVLKFHLPDDERFAMGMVFGAVGVLNCVFLWPGLVLLSVTGAEKFAWPSWQQLWPLLMNSLVGTNLSDVLWARSVVLTSPVVATLGLSLTTPLAMVVDAISKNAHFSGAYVAGAVLVMVGFLLANLPI